MSYINCILHKVQAAPILCVCISHDFALTWLENLHHLSNLCNNFWFNAIWHRWSMATLIFCRRLAGNDVTTTPSVTCRDWLFWLYNHAAHLVSYSTALAFLTNMNDKCKSASPSAIQVKNRRKTISTEEKLNVISRLEKSKWIVDICHNVWLAQSSVHTIRDNTDRIKESAKSGTKAFDCVARLPQSYRKEPYQKLWMSVSYIFIELEINKHIVQKLCILYTNVYVLHTNVYVLHTQYIYTLQVHMSTRGIIIHYIGWGCQSPNPQEIHCFKWEFCVQFAWFRFAWRFSGT
jgi:hypothetical protein